MQLQKRIPNNEVIMRIARLGAGLAALMLSAQVLAAQQPTPPQRPDSGMTGASGMAARMQMMDSLNARLDTLVSRMNRATGNKKVAAMADVINELVAQRKLMQKQMHQMMESREGMMQMMRQPTPSEGHPPTPKADSAAADTSGHAEHHPSN